MDKKEQSIEALKAREHEHEKTRLQRAEDIAYTINHAISCGLTDIAVQPYVGVWAINAIEKSADAGKFPSWLKWLQNLFERPHDHHGHHGKDCADTHHPLKPPSFWKNVVHWTSAEFLGDVGAVPATIVVQRMAPGLMDGIRHGLEPIAGEAFRKGAHHASLTWAQKNGYAANSTEQKAKENELYEYEMSHLPQAVMWNVFAWPTNVLLQRYVFKHHGHEHSLGTIAVGKTFGALFSNTALIGGRALAPDVAHQWDQWSSENLILPTTKVIGGALGVDHETSEKVAQRHAESEGKSWQQREETKRTQTAASTMISTS